MDWKRTYFRLVMSRKESETPSDYHERHHIVPKSEGGSDNPDNLVSLTPREHYIAHLLLAHIYNDQKMWCAVKLMRPREGKYSSRLYEVFRHRQIAWNKGVPCPEDQRQRISNKLRGRKLATDTRKKMSEKRKGQTNNFTGHHHSEYTKIRISRKMVGRKKPEGYSLKQAISQGRSIVQLSEDGNVIAEFPSSGEAQRMTGISNIRRAVKNGKTAGGYHWKWKNK